MQITLSDGMVIEVLAIDLAHNAVDWRRTSGPHTGACKSACEITSQETATAEITAAIEADLGP